MFGREGGYVNVKSDGGGPTKYRDHAQDARGIAAQAHSGKGTLTHQGGVRPRDCSIRSDAARSRYSSILSNAASNSVSASCSLRFVRGSSKERRTRARIAFNRSACSCRSRCHTRMASRTTSLVEAYSPATSRGVHQPLPLSRPCAADPVSHVCSCTLVS
ncbi:hypothetical protein DSM25559_4289 [Agrobacterium rosae]|uniref:Uncharacterized protein n=1 Tax=Agrobacterium rosae TaxID=1972867 RepID=A0A1R3U002_9HYPH|nr:hypothetical protein DSM25559_4289 [Agrobacterium rosae]